ncbi:MAG: hypothetical protein QOJ87_1948 [Verrucomicrobiota bacterium]
MGPVSSSARAQTNYEPYTCTTVAPGATFNLPTAVAIDLAGNIYVADTGNQTIRKITPLGVVSILAGSTGVIGSADGTGGAALFYNPYGIAADAAGNLYVADTFNSTVRRVTPGGVVTTLAGLAGTTGSADGTSANARFNQPQGIAVDGAGNVYVADSVNQTIRQITPSGVVTTLAGLAGTSGNTDGVGSAARFLVPQSLAIDGANDLYVADSGNNTIRKVTLSGTVTTVAGVAGTNGSADGSGSAALFVYPQGLAVDSLGNVFVADSGNDLVRKITPAAVATTIAGMPGTVGNSDGTGSAARFSTPQGVAVNNTGKVYVADSNNNLIRVCEVTTANASPTPSPSATPVQDASPSPTPRISGSPVGGSVGWDWACPFWVVPLATIVLILLWLYFRRQKRRKLP